MSAHERPVKPESNVTTASHGFADDRYARLYEYLYQQLKESDAGEIYLKSKFIANEVELSPRQIGALIPRLKKMDIDFNIEKWGYTAATTWRVTLAEP